MLKVMPKNCAFENDYVKQETKCRSYPAFIFFKYRINLKKFEHFFPLKRYLYESARNRVTESYKLWVFGKETRDVGICVRQEMGVRI